MWGCPNELQSPYVLQRSYPTITVAVIYDENDTSNIQIVRDKAWTHDGILHGNSIHTDATVGLRLSTEDPHPYFTTS
jgi:hypothetical protein